LSVYRSLTVDKI